MVTRMKSVAQQVCTHPSHHLISHSQQARLASIARSDWLPAPVPRNLVRGPSSSSSPLICLLRVCMLSISHAASVAPASLRDCTHFSSLSPPAFAPPRCSLIDRVLPLFAAPRSISHSAATPLAPAALLLGLPLHALASVCHGLHMAVPACAAAAATCRHSSCAE